jgi:hypothetical protein
VVAIGREYARLVRVEPNLDRRAQRRRSHGDAQPEPLTRAFEFEFMKCAAEPVADNPGLDTGSA